MNLILYFVKYPEPGKVKTRLARDLGNVRAARAYRHLGRSGFDVLMTLRENGVATAVVYDPPERADDVRAWLPGADDYWPQTGGGLGERLEKAFEKAFASGAMHAAALGSDTLGLEPGIVLAAFEGLDGCDIVLGPAEDGGYYLIGASEPCPGLFGDIPWSTSKVFEHTVRRIKQHGLSYFLLPPLRDLDEVKRG